jgi:hypothetical protein
MPSDEMVEKVARAKELLADIVNLPYELHAPLLRFMECAHPETLSQLRAALSAAHAEPVGWRYPVGPTFAECSICWAFATSKDEAEKRSIWGGVHPVFTSPPSEAAIRADEREKCAMIADAETAAEHGEWCNAKPEDKAYHLWAKQTAQAIATAIRARGET